MKIERHSYTSSNQHERADVEFSRIETLEDYLEAKDASSRQDRDNGSGGH